MTSRPRTPRRDGGWTLIELLFAIAMASVVIALSLAKFGPIIADSTTQADTQSTTNAVAFRTAWTGNGYAVADGYGDHPIDRGAASTDLVAYHDANHNGHLDADEWTVAAIHVLPN